MERILLASASPRRRALLRQVGIPFRAVDPSVDELTGVPAELTEQVTVLAERKVKAVVHLRGRLRWILGCDTLVEIEGLALGKPSGRAEAREYLARLAGRVHCVHTGLALYSQARGRIDLGLATTRVCFRPLSAEEIDWYLDTEEWEGAAGGYRVQGRGAFLVSWIEGSYSNVVGLPLETFYGMLRAGGYRFGRPA